MPDRYCAICGGPIWSTDPRRVTCGSPGCRAAHSRRSRRMRHHRLVDRRCPRCGAMVRMERCHRVCRACSAKAQAEGLAKARTKARALQLRDRGLVPEYQMTCPWAEGRITGPAAGADPVLGF